MKQEYIEARNNIAAILSEELEKLSAQKEQETNQLLEKIKVLESHITDYKNKYNDLENSIRLEKEKAASNFSNQGAEQLNAFLLDYLARNEDMEVIKDLFYSIEIKNSKEKALYYQLLITQTFTEHKRASLISPCLEMVINKLRLTEVFDEEWVSLIKKLLVNIFQDYSINLGEIDDIYINAFKLIQHFSDNPFCQYTFQSFLEKEAEFIISNSMDLNSTYVIDELLLTYFLYELDEMVDEILDRIIEEWQFIDVQLSLGQYIRILWYAFYFGRDEEVLEQSKESADYLEEDIPEIKLYSLYYDLLNHHQTSSEEIKQLIDRMKFFTNFEKVWLFDKLESNLKENAVKNSSLNKYSLEENNAFKSLSTEIKVIEGNEEKELTSNGVKENLQENAAKFSDKEKDILLGSHQSKSELKSDEKNIVADIPVKQLLELSTQQFISAETKRKNEDSAEIYLESISKLPKKGAFHSAIRKSLKEKSVKLAVYQNQYTNEPDYYEDIIGLYFHQSNEFYISKSQIRNLKKKVKNSNLWIDIDHIDKEGLFIRTERVQLIPLENNNQKESQQDLFKWPTTEVKTSMETFENPDLSNKSELRELGYQITGLTRAKRWDILSEKAVPKLGLKKVAYTIAFLVRGRKAMKNGLIRNRNAITEWEYDLERLKKYYYKKDFVWPSTSVKI